METFQVLALLLPKVPLVIRVAIMHVLRLSAPASYIDLRSELIISITRSFLSQSRPWRISDAQKLSLRDPGIKGKIWVSTYASPVPPETSLRDALLEAIDDMRDHDAPRPRFRVPDFAAVEAEWTGYRSEAKPGEPLPEMSEVEKYKAMNDECSKPTTILYLHGGAYYLCDPSSHRPTTKKLAKLTGGRCYSVRYRLAPQYPFPAALLDALISYFTLLYPPPDAYHDAVAPEHIVFSGDR
jgi:acetyl esterase/lipase